MGHVNHRENGAYTLNEVKQFRTLFPSGQTAVVVGIESMLGSRRPEIEALCPEDFDGQTMRVHRETKTGNDVRLPVIAPLRRHLANGWEPINLDRTEQHIRERLVGTSLTWRGWYGFRRGLASILWELGVKPEVASLVLRNTPEVTRKHYLKLRCRAFQGRGHGEAGASTRLRRKMCSSCTAGNR